MDGISYSSIAYPVPYEKMISLENIPKEFKVLELTFVSEDETVKVVPVKYGETLSAADIPEVPQKDGSFGKWEDFNYENITFSAEINAVYEKFVTALESAEKRDGGLPIFVAEGNFTDSDRMTVAENNAAEGIESWSVTLPDDGAASHRVRFLPTVKPSKAVVTVTENGVQRAADTETDGKYLVVEIFGDSAVVEVSERDNTVMIIAAASAAAAAVMVVLIMLIRKKRKSTPKNSNKKIKEKSRV